MAIKKDHRFMTGTQPALAEEEEERASRPSERELLRWRRWGVIRGLLIYIVSPILLALIIGAVAYLTRPESMPAHERIREVAREVQARRLREAQGAAGEEGADASAPELADAGAPPR